MQARDSGRKRQSKAERTGMGKTEAEMRRDISQHRQTEQCADALSIDLCVTIMVTQMLQNTCVHAHTHKRGQTLRNT